MEEKRGTRKERKIQIHAASDGCASKSAFVRTIQQELSCVLCKGNARMYDRSLLTLARGVGGVLCPDWRGLLTRQVRSSLGLPSLFSTFILHVVHSQYFVFLSNVRCTLLYITVTSNDSSNHLQCVSVHIVVLCLWSFGFFLSPETSPVQSSFLVPCSCIKDA